MKPNYHNFKPKGMIIEPCDYRGYLGSTKWKSIRKEVIKRDDGVCQCCLQKIKYRVIVHHTDYCSLFNERLEDLTTLCNRCHAEIHWIYPAPRYKWFDRKLLKISLPDKWLVERIRYGLRNGNRMVKIPRDAEHYADRILYEVGLIEAGLRFSDDRA